MASNNVQRTIEKHNFRLSVRIRNYQNNQINYYAESPEIECNRQCGTKWVVRISQRREIGCTNEVHLILVEKQSDAKISATYSFHVVGRYGEIIKMSQMFQLKAEDHHFPYGNCYIITDCEIQRNKELYLPDGHLKIRCEGTEFLEQNGSTHQVQNLPASVVGPAPNRYAELVKKMYQDGICCDVILKTGDVEFNCHKAILASTSNYFQAMFQNDNQQNVVDVSKDLNGEEAQAMLDFIYLDNAKLPTLSTASFQTLFKVSKTYEIGGGLKDACEMELIRQLNANNALEVLNFAAEFGAKRLTKSAALFIANSPD